jgi:hypothetical protein
VCRTNYGLQVPRLFAEQAHAPDGLRPQVMRSVRWGYEEMGYITEARIRAARRRSAWNLLLIPCYMVPWFLLTFGSVVALGRLYAVVHAGSEFRVLPDTVGGILMAVGSLFAWLGPSMILANHLVSAVPAARRALDREAATVPGTDRRSANGGLLKISCLLVLGGAFLALVGVFIPW